MKARRLTLAGYAMHGGIKGLHSAVYLENLREWDLDISVMRILTCIVEKFAIKICPGLDWFRIGSNDWLLWWLRFHIKEFLNHLKNWQRKIVPYIYIWILILSFNFFLAYQYFISDIYLLFQQISFKNLVERNRSVESKCGPPAANSAIQLPFIIVNTSRKTVIDCSISNDK